MIYLDNGATSFPKSPGMIEAMNECMKKYCGNPGRSGHYMSIKTGEEVYKARRNVAEIFGVSDPTRLIFTQNTTAALNMGIKGVLCVRDHAVTTAMEHNSVLRPLKALERCGVSHTIVGCAPCGTVSVDDIRNAIRPETRLVICSHASNVTGTIQDIEAIGQMIRRLNACRSADKQILFMVDGAQSAGCVPIDVDAMGIDLLAVPGHKGLLGPLGTGALYVRNGVDIYPITEGGTGTASKDREQPLEMPEGFEAGTVNAPGIIGLGCSSAWVQRTGVSNIRRYEEELITPLHEALCEMPNVCVYGPASCAQKTAVIAFNVVDGSKRDFGSSYSDYKAPVAIGCEEVCDRLANEYNIATRGGFHCAGLAHRTIGTWDTGAVRISAGPFNTRRHIKAAIDAVYRISKSV